MPSRGPRSVPLSPLHWSRTVGGPTSSWSGAAANWSSFEGSNRMFFPRATLILLPCPAMAALCASFVGVHASPCLPSAPAVRQEHPGAWPSWTLRVPGHEGTKCWYPATRTTAHSHRYEVVPNRASIETRKLQSTLEGSSRNGTSLAETNGLDWSPPSGATQIATTPVPEQNSFADRFAAVIRVNSSNPSSIIRFMIDPIGSRS